MDFAKWISFSLVIIFIYILWQIKNIILLAFTAIILAITLNILVDKLRILGIKRKYAVFCATLIFILALLSFILLILPPLFFQFQELFNLVPQGIDKLIIQVDKFKKILSPEINIWRINLEDIRPQLEALIGNLVSKGLNFISGFLGALLSSLLLLALTLMLLGDPLFYQKGFVRFFPKFYRPRANNILQKITVELEKWLKDIFIQIIAVTILTYLFLSIFQLPLVLVQSLLAGILVFIPYIGFFISLIPPMAIAFIDSPITPWLILIVYILIHQVIDKIMIAKLRKNRVKLVAGSVIIGEVIFANFLGLLGLFLAIPLVIISQILVKEILINDIFDHWQKNRKTL